ncbi:histidine phosphatase family protein [Xanthomonas sp. AmX2]|nr:histidine phosphatase family protein [Xanthomonas sp.]
MSELRIDLLRHGDTGRRGYRGQLDDPLSGRGWAQLNDAVDGHEWDWIVASPLRRCAQFADALARRRRLPLTLDARLAEYHFGDWQGVPMATLAERHGDALGRFWADPVAHPPPAAEPFMAFVARLRAALDAIVAGRAPACARVLVVTHGGAIRALRCIAEARAFADASAFDVAHASLYPLRWPPAHGAAGASAQASTCAHAPAPAATLRPTVERPRDPPSGAGCAAAIGHAQDATAPAPARGATPGPARRR